MPAAGSFVVPGGPPAAAGRQPGPAVRRRPASSTCAQPPPRAPAPRKRHRGRNAALVILVLALLLGRGRLVRRRRPGLEDRDAQRRRQDHRRGASRSCRPRACTPRSIQVFSETVPVGRVVATDPGPGQSVSKHGTVTLDVSKGPERYPVPNVAGHVAAGRPRPRSPTTKLAVGPDHPGSTATRSRPASSSPPTPPPAPCSRPSKPVDLVVSKGPAPVDLADWTGKPADPGHPGAAGRRPEGQDDRRSTTRPSPRAT